MSERCGDSLRGLPAKVPHIKEKQIMRKLVSAVLFALVTLVPVAFANEIPDCRLGVAPVNVDREAQPGDQKFTAPKGAVVRMEFRKEGQQRLSYVRCKFAADTESYAVAPGLAWDIPSGNDFRAENWTIPYEMSEGRPGKAATVEIGAVTAGAPGEADVTNSGTETAAVLNFTIPEGRPGVNCWDTNKNSKDDPNEDMNHDGLWDAHDCIPTIIPRKNAYLRWWDDHPVIATGVHVLGLAVVVCGTGNCSGSNNYRHEQVH